MNRWTTVIGVLIVLGIGGGLLLQNNQSNTEKQVQASNGSENNFGYVVEYGRVDYTAHGTQPLMPAPGTPSIDVASFKALSRGFVQDKHGIYFTRETPDYVYYGVVSDADAATFVTTGDICAKDKNSYYLIKHQGEHYGAELQKIASLDTAQCTY